MQVDNRFLDDLARVANGAAGALSGVREEVEALVRQRAERFLADMDLVTRDEFEAVKAVAAKARLEQEALEARVAALEAALFDLQKSALKPRRTRNPATSVYQPANQFRYSLQPWSGHQTALSNYYAFFLFRPITACLWQIACGTLDLVVR